MPEHVRFTRNRREFLCDACCGVGSLAFGAILAQEAARAAAMNPLAPKPPHHKAKAKSMIFLFLAGGPSQMDTFDPKPLLNELNGQKRPASFGEAKYQFIAKDAKLLGTKRTAVEFRVTDTGIGIPEAERDKVFDAFYQVDSSSTREQGGTGLGLSIVRRLVEGHDGTVHIEGNQPNGTVFVVTIPVRRATIG